MYQDWFCNVNGCRIRYWELGSASSARLLLLHGIGGAVETWEALLPALSDHFHVYALDLLGFGQSDKNEQTYTVANLVKLVSGFVNLKQISRFSLVGHSLGGEVAAGCALICNVQVDRLVLIASGGFGSISPWFRLVGLIGFTPLLSLLLGNNKIGLLLLRRIYGPFLSDWAIHRLVTYWKNRETARAFAKYTMQSVGWLSAKAARIQQPTLLLWGDRDKIVPLRQGQLAKNLLKNSILEVVSGAGHNVHTQHPDIVISVVSNFLWDKA